MLKWCGVGVNDVGIDRERGMVMVGDQEGGVDEECFQEGEEDKVLFTK